MNSILDTSLKVDLIHTKTEKTLDIVSYLNNKLITFFK